jgi:hypothetical protein
VKYGITREEAEWIKCHLMTGTRTNSVTVVEILDKNAADSPQFRPLVETTAGNFKIREVPADKGYLSADNLELVAALGSTAYIPFKVNCLEGSEGSAWAKMSWQFVVNRDAFLRHCHARSNVESTISAIKRKFGDSVRSKGDVAQKNEVLCKILAHKVCCCIAALYELGIDPAFGEKREAPRAVLPFPRSVCERNLPCASATAPARRSARVWCTGWPAGYNAVALRCAASGAGSSASARPVAGPRRVAWSTWHVSGRRRAGASSGSCFRSVIALGVGRLSKTAE